MIQCTQHTPGRPSAGLIPSDGPAVGTATFGARPVMNPCRWLLALLAAFGLLPLVSSLLAQAPPDRPSHRPVNTGLEEDLRPEEALERRLRPFRDEKAEIDKLSLNSDIAQLARRLLKDE